MRTPWRWAFACLLILTAATRPSRAEERPLTEPLLPRRDNPDHIVSVGLHIGWIEADATAGGTVAGIAFDYYITHRFAARITASRMLDPWVFENRGGNLEANARWTQGSLGMQGRLFTTPRLDVGGAALLGAGYVASGSGPVLDGRHRSRVVALAAAELFALVRVVGSVHAGIRGGAVFALPAVDITLDETSRSVVGRPSWQAMATVEYRFAL